MILNLKKILSYFFEFSIEKRQSEFSGEVVVSLSKGEYMLSTQNAIYSYGNYKKYNSGRCRCSHYWVGQKISSIESEKQRNICMRRCRKICVKRTTSVWFNFVWCIYRRTNTHTVYAACFFYVVKKVSGYKWYFIVFKNQWLLQK